MESQTVSDIIQKKNRSVCKFCESNIQNEVKAFKGNEPMHMITINNATCNTGHLHISSLTHNEDGHHHNYEVNYNIYLVKSNVKFLHLR